MIQEVITILAIWGAIDVARRIIKWLIRPMVYPQEI